MQATQNPGHPALLPATLHELLHARVHALPEDTQSVLRAAAVIGRPALVPLLAATTGTLVEQTETLLRPAIDQHVVEIRRDDTIAFRHPAFGEVVYAELMPAERQRLHRAAAEALEPTGGLGTGQRSSVAGDAVSGELARHWFGAGDTERALDAAVAAGWAAERMYAFADAYTNFTRALALMDEVTDSPARPGPIAQARGPGRQPGRETAPRPSGSSRRRSRSPPTHRPGRRCSPGWGSSTTAPAGGRSPNAASARRWPCCRPTRRACSWPGSTPVWPCSARRGRASTSRRSRAAAVSRSPARSAPAARRGCWSTRPGSSRPPTATSIGCAVAAAGPGHRGGGRQSRRPGDGLHQPHPRARARRPGRRDRRGRPSRAPTSSPGWAWPASGSASSRPTSPRPSATRGGSRSPAG